MNKLFITTAMLATIGSSSIATAQQTCEQQRTGRTIGTVAGAGVGAVLGSVIAGRGDKTIGAIVGGLGGGLVGNQVTKSKADCAHAYGYYDRVGAWHANDVQASAATGYYDRDGQWVDGVPRGYYDSNNRWVAAADSDATRSGYRDQHGHWVPASSNGYYDADNGYRPGSVSGHYMNGRWVSGQTTGRYDANGRWQAGEAAGRRGPDGNWVYDPQPGYYDANGRWRRGSVSGYYDTRGAWIATSGSPVPQGYANGYDDRSTASRDVRSRENRIQDRIETASNDGTLNRQEAYRASNELSSIRRDESALRGRSGRLSPRAEATIQARLDRLSDSLRSARQDARAGY